MDVHLGGILFTCCCLCTVAHTDLSAIPSLPSSEGPGVAPGADQYAEDADHFFSGFESSEEYGGIGEVEADATSLSRSYSLLLGNLGDAFDTMFPEHNHDDHGDHHHHGGLNHSHDDPEKDDPHIDHDHHDHEQEENHVHRHIGHEDEGVDGLLGERELVTATSMGSHHHHQQQHVDYHNGNGNDAGHSHGHAHKHHLADSPVILTPGIWVSALASISLISLVGLLAVACLPLLRGNRRERILQGLISIAVGTLIGDSFIHLVPHAFLMSHGGDVTWKGFVATLVIIFFFALDQFLSVRGISHGHSHSVPHVDPVILKPETLTSLHSHVGSNSDIADSSHADSNSEIYAESADDSIGSNRSGKRYRMSNASVMVIIGDSVHNFADGIAIGAAFSMGYATGLSTSVAVLCHELPHEIGDFALLIQSGMSVKRALFYNLLSSIFGLLGLVSGLLLGTTGQFSTWLLAGIIGVFLYVALVSMLPELVPADIPAIFINISTMILGAGLLLVIGLYEEELILILEFA